MEEKGIFLADDGFTVKAKIPDATVPMRNSQTTRSEKGLAGGGGEDVTGVAATDSLVSVSALSEVPASVSGEANNFRIPTTDPAVVNSVK